MSMNRAELPGDLSLGWMKSPIPKNVADPEAYKAARGFEAYFARYLVKQMQGNMNMIGGKGYGGKIYQDMFVDAISEEVANKGSLGIAKMIYRQVMQQKGQQPYQDDKKLDTTLLPERLEKYKDYVKNAAESYRLDPEMVFAVMDQESGGDTNAVSPAGAKGLMQLIDSTAADMGVTDAFDPRQNIHGGAKYLREQLDRFGDPKLALAAYNAGPAAVRKYGGIPPYKETQDYVKKVMGKYEALRKGTDAVDQAKQRQDMEMKLAAERYGRRQTGAVDADGE